MKVIGVDTNTLLLIQASTKLLLQPIRKAYSGGSRIFERGFSFSKLLKTTAGHYVKSHPSLITGVKP